MLPPFQDAPTFDWWSSASAKAFQKMGLVEEVRNQYSLFMPVVAKHRFNAREYYQMAKAGVLKPDAQVELLDGEILDMSPIGPFHGGVVNHLGHLFHLLAHGRWVVSIQNPLHLDEHSEPQPDLMLLKPATDNYKTRHPGPEQVLLLIEVADTSLEYDREKKLPAYGRAGIAESWLVNLDIGCH